MKVQRPKLQAENNLSLCRWHRTKLDPMKAGSGYHNEEEYKPVNEVQVEIPHLESHTTVLL